MAKHLTKKQREELSSRHAGTRSKRNEGTRELFYSFLIVSEGTKTEPEYFRHFTSRRSRVQVVGADRSTKKLLEEALRIRDLSTFDYKWLIFDKDDNDDFNEAILYPHSKLSCLIKACEIVCKRRNLAVIFRGFDCPINDFR